MENNHRLDYIGRENLTLEEVIKTLSEAIKATNKEYALELAFEKEFGLKSQSIAKIAAALDFLKTQRTMRQMSFLENEKTMRAILIHDVLSDKSRLN